MGDDETDLAGQPSWDVAWDEGPDGSLFTTDGQPAVSPLLTAPDLDLLVRALERLSGDDHALRLRGWFEQLQQNLRARAASA